MHQGCVAGADEGGEGSGGLLAVAYLAWRLWFRPSSDSLAWRRGAAGERRTARLLALWSGRGGRSCTTWPSPARPPTSTIW